MDLERAGEGQWDSGRRIGCSKFGPNCGGEVLSQRTLVGSPACWRGGACERRVISETTKITLDNNKMKTENA